MNIHSCSPYCLEYNCVVEQRDALRDEAFLLQRKIRKLESQLRIFRKANRGKCLPAKGQTGKHATRQALVQSVMAAGMAGRTPQRIAADEGVSTTVIYNILAQYGGAIALRKRKA